MKALKRGVLIAFEGIDGSGKSTQARALGGALREKGYDVVLSSEPTRGRWGRKIADLRRRGREGLSAEEELDLFMKDRREHVREVVAPGLERGAVVILDRYYFSSAAYQGARGLDPGDILERNELFAPRPDLVFILTIDPDKGIERVVSERRDEPDAFERVRDLKRVEEIFESFEGDHILRVEGDRTEQKINKLVLSRVLDLIEDRKREEP